KSRTRETRARDVDRGALRAAPGDLPAPWPPQPARSPGRAARCPRAAPALARVHGDRPSLGGKRRLAPRRRSIRSAPRRLALAPRLARAVAAGGRVAVPQLRRAVRVERADARADPR